MTDEDNGYANNISLLYDTINDTKAMLKTLEYFAKQHDIVFNASNCH